MARPRRGLRSVTIYVRNIIAFNISDDIRVYTVNAVGHDAYTILILFLMYIHERVGSSSVMNGLVLMAAAGSRYFARARARARGRPPPPPATHSDVRSAATNTCTRPYTRYYASARPSVS